MTKNEEQMLFPEVKVGDITVKPWSFGILFDISDLLEEVINKAEEKDILDEINRDIIPYTTIAKLFTLASKQVLKIVSITLDMEEDEVKKFKMEDGIKITGIIARQNWEIISKNLINLLPNPEKEEKKKKKEKE